MGGNFVHSGNMAIQTIAELAVQIEQDDYYPD